MYRILLIAACLFVLSTANARADGDYAHVDQLADEIKSRVNDVCWELYNFHRPRPEYAETYRTAYEMWMVADHVHDLFHGNATNKQRIARNVSDLSELFEQLNAGISRWSGPARGQGCPFRLKQKLATLEIAVQHLMSDTGVTRATPSVAATGSALPVPAIEPAEPSLREE